VPLRAPVLLPVVVAAAAEAAPAWAQAAEALPRPALVAEVLAAAEPEEVLAEPPWLPEAWAWVPPYAPP
jgi:hypothetical protein